VLTEPDRHGEPALSSKHGVCTAFRDFADAYDWNFCWKVWDALRAAVASGASPEAAVADTPRHRSNGSWSDGRPDRAVEGPAHRAHPPVTDSRARTEWQ
jgi:hypothetical protein